MTEKACGQVIPDGMKKRMMEKKYVIDNFICYFTSDDKEREQMRATLKDYLEDEQTKEED